MVDCYRTVVEVRLVAIGDLGSYASLLPNKYRHKTYIIIEIQRAFMSFEIFGSTEPSTRTDPRAKLLPQYDGCLNSNSYFETRTATDPS